MNWLSSWHKATQWLVCVAGRDYGLPVFVRIRALLELYVSQRRRGSLNELQAENYVSLIILAFEI